MWSNDDRSTTTTRAIVTDYFNWRLKVKTATNDRLCIIVRNIGFDCETSYFSQEPFFHFRFPALSLIDVRNIHYEIAKELFNDGSITWTRIITFISFSAILAEYLIKQQQQNSDILISSLIDWTTNFIDIDLHTWLESQNYWAGCLKLYGKTSQRRNSISHYASILRNIGMLTLGLLYMKRT